MKHIHIGKKIKEVFDLSGLTVTEFAKRLNMSRENVYGVFKRKSIDTELLYKISKTLNHDFFIYFISEELKNELNRIKEENSLLKELITFLKKENK